MRIAVAILLLSACNTGNNFVAEGQPDLATAVVATPDSGPAPPDLLIPGPSCASGGDVRARLRARSDLLRRLHHRRRSADLASLGNLLCAGTSCLTGLGGGGDGGLAGGSVTIDTTQLFFVLAQSCAAQLSMCGGLFGGFGGGQ